MQSVSSEVWEESDNATDIHTPTSSTSSSNRASTPSQHGGVVVTTPTRHATALSDKFDFAFRCSLLGDTNSMKRQWAHSVAYGKYSKAAAMEDSILEQACG